MTVFGKRVLDALKPDRRLTVEELMALTNLPRPAIYRGISEARADGYIMYCRSVPGQASEWSVLTQ